MALPHDKIAVQGLILPVAYQLGLQCPFGLEAELLSGLERFWPELGRTTEARKLFLQGLQDRFNDNSETGGNR